MGIRLMLADDHELIRDALTHLLNQESDIEVVAETGNSQEVLEYCNRSQPDIVVMDINLESADAGIDATKRLRSHHPQVKVIALSCYTDKIKVQKMLDAGAVGYVAKAAPSQALLNAIRAAYNNRSYFSQEISNALIESACSRSDSTLGRREVEVLTLFANGKHASEIGNTLHISVSTVEAHRRNIMRKLDMHSIVDLTKYALREGLAEL